MSVELINGHVLIPDLPNWQTKPQWRRQWQTQIGDVVTGAEDRGAMRQTPLVQLSFLVTPLTQPWQSQFEERVMAALQSGLAAVPYWGRGLKLTANFAPAGGGNLFFNYTNTPWEFLAGGKLFFVDASNPQQAYWEVHNITAQVTGGQLVLTDDPAITWPAGTLIYPVLFGKPTIEDMSLVTNQRGAMKLTVRELTGATISSASSAPTYLSRPIWTLPIDWSQEITKQFKFDLREFDLGFGATKFAPLQQHIVQGFDFSIQRRTDPEIQALDDFTAALKGRLSGFWFPSPLELGKDFAVVSGTTFKLADQGLAERWDNQPAQYVLFQYADGTLAARQITGVTDNGDGTETVMVGTSFTGTNIEHVSLLHYVRLADDEEAGVFIADGWQQRNIRVLELPMEYAAVETGESPVLLYEFTLNLPTPQLWRYTSFAKDFVSNSHTYTAKALTHGAISRGTRGESQQVTVDAFYETGHPLAIGFPYPPSATLSLVIKAATYGAPNTTKVLFTGVLSDPPRQGKKISATFSAKLDLDSQRLFTANISPRCAYQVYDPRTCGVDPATKEIAATISTLSGRVIRVTHATDLSGKPAQYFAFGWIKTGTGANYEARTVLQSTIISSTVHELTLNLPLANAAVSQAITLRPGCDGRWDTCQTKFSNDKFFGHRFVPNKNLSLTAIPVQVSKGGKK